MILKIYDYVREYYEAYGLFKNALLECDSIMDVSMDKMRNVEDDGDWH